MPDLIYHRIPDVPGLAIAVTADPTGNNEPTVEICLDDEDGVAHHSGVFVGVHGGGPWNLRVLVGNPGAGASDYFELDPDTGRVRVIQL